MDVNGLVTLEYESLEWEDHNFSTSSLEKLRALLTIRKEGNVIYICHPKHLFDVMEEDPDTKEIKAVDFNRINVERMLQRKDFGRYSIVQQICCKRNNQFTYLWKRASHMIRKYQEEGTPQFSYPLAILEESNSDDGKKQYFVRGIVSFHQEGVLLAFNPLAVKECPRESVWQKGLRVGGHFY